MAMLGLKDVTVCAVDTAHRGLAARALRECTQRCEFADAILFSDAQAQGPFRTERIATLRSSADYSKFILKDLHAFIATPHVLVVQWDGYVVDPAAWTDEFLQYDYVGAKWGWYQDGMTVGNGGFSLRSSKLLKATTDPRLPLQSGTPEDMLICRSYRPALATEFGIRYAPEALADRFSYERSMPQAPTFGFHGLFNMWRYVEDADMVALVGELGKYRPDTREYLELVAQYYALRKFVPLRAIYARLRAAHSPAQIQHLMAPILVNERFIAECIRACEATLAAPVSPPGA